tara:strand:- start:192 stop:320 length:129 start_codon:yes stop_codon:yes gene_type:complete
MTLMKDEMTSMSFHEHVVRERLGTDRQHAWLQPGVVARFRVP